MGSPADATMAEMMDGALAQRLRDEELARRIGKALAGKRPTLEDLPRFATSARRDEGVGGPIDPRAEAPWGPFERRRASTEEQRKAVFATTASAPVIVAPPAPRRGARWPWIVAAMIASAVAVQLAAPQSWTAVAEHATHGVAWLRDATRAQQSHGDAARSVAMSAIATPSVDVDTEAPTFVPYPMPVVVTTAPRVVTPSSAVPPPPPPRPEPVASPRRASRNVATPKPSTHARPVAPSPATTPVVPANEAATDAPAATTPVSIPEPPERTAMNDPEPKPIPREDPPSDAPPIQEPPPSESPPGEVPEIREPPPTDVPTQGGTAEST